MKIGKYKISGGPNLEWYITTLMFGWASIAAENWWLMGGWILFNIVLIPICLWLHKWNDKKQKLHDEWMKNEDIS